jgi:hypothetical protein
MKISKRLAVVVIGACLLGPAVAVRGASMSATGNVPFTIVQDGASVDPNHSLVGVQFGSAANAASAAVISAASAVEAARNAAGLATNSSPKVTAFYTLFSDTMYANRGSDGKMHPQFVNVPAWVVTFTGIDHTSYGGFPRGGTNSATPRAIHNHEMHVVINAVTGSYMEQYSYR